MRHRTQRICIALGLVALSLFGLPSLARAEKRMPGKIPARPRYATPRPTGNLINRSAADPLATAGPPEKCVPSPGVICPVETVLIIPGLKPFVVGEHPTVVVQLTTATGERVGALANEVMLLFVDDVLERRIRTDSEGIAPFSIRRELAVGTHALRGVYPGSRALLSSNAAAELVIEPAEVEIRTIPPLPGIGFSLAGRTFTSDEAGVARIEVKQVGTYPLEILPSAATESDIRVAFTRWGDEVFAPSRDVEVPLKKPLEAGFEVSYQVGQTFVDLSGQPVDPAWITSLTLKGSNGVSRTFEDGRPRWLSAGRVVRRAWGLEETKILYSVISVVMDGTNVVSQAQQRFYIQPNDVWSIQIMLYAAHFAARDALFRFPLGSGLRLEYPDGHSQVFPFGPGAELEVKALARGLYRVTVVGARGMAPPTPLAMSRDQDIELLVVSYLDMAVASMLGVGLAVGLLFFGRPHLLAWLGRLPSRLAPQPLVSAYFSGIRPHLTRWGRHLNLRSPEIPRPAAVRRMVEGLSPIVATLTIGTNLALFHVLRALVSGRLLASRGAIIPALAPSPSGLAPEAGRHAGAAVAYGARHFTSLLAPWPQLIQHEGRWRAYRLFGYRLVAVDVVGFFRPRPRRSPTQHFLSQVGKAWPAIRFGVIADIGSVDRQAVPILRAVVRAPQAAQRGTTLQTAMLAQAGRQLAPDEALVGDRSFSLTRVLAAGVPRFILRATKSFTARRAALAAYAGRGRRPTRGERVRPLSRVFRGKPLPATPPDRTECWITQGRRLRADFWDQLVARNALLTDVLFTCVVLYDPAYCEPLSVVTNLLLTGPQLHAFYCESWPILSNCLSLPGNSLASGARSSLPGRPDHA